MSSFQITVSPVVNAITVADSAPTVSVAGTTVAIVDGDKGDITVTGGGSTWTIDTGAVTETKIGSQAVTATKIGNGAVVEAKLADNAVATAKINDAAVTNSKIAAKSVTLDKMTDTATGVLLGRASLSTGQYENLSVSSDLSLNAVSTRLELAARAARSVMGNPTASTAAPTSIVASADGDVLRRASGTLGFGTIPASSVTAAGSDTQVMFNSAGAFAGDSGLTYDSATDTLTVGTAGSGAIVMGNGEFLSNSTNGTVRIGTNGTASTDFAMTVDGTSWGFGVTLGTRRNSDGSTTAGGFLCNTAWRMGNGVEFAMGGANWYTLSYQESTRGVLAVGLLVGSSGSSGSMVLCQNNQKGTANRVPSIAHDDPTLYVYGRGSTNASDYVRINHNTTDGFVESGRGQLRLTAPSSSGGGVRIDSSWYGINLAPTAVQTGYTAFTNPATTRTCNTATVTLQQLAQIVGTLVEDLKTKGIISA